jgi:hypothetical protein
MNRQQDQRPDQEDRKGTSGHGVSGGNAGAGKSGKEDMGSEKPTDGKELGSRKPDTASEGSE